MMASTTVKCESEWHDDLIDFQSKMDFILASIGAFAELPEGDTRLYAHKSSLLGLYLNLMEICNDLATIVNQSRQYIEAQAASAARRN